MEIVAISLTTTPLSFAHLGTSWVSLRARVFGKTIYGLPIRRVKNIAPIKP